MKKLLLIILLFPALAISQFNSDGYLSYEKVYEVDLTKSEIHKGVTEWIATTYNYPDVVTKMSSPDKIIINPGFEILTEFQGYSMPINVKYNLSTEFKDGRYKLAINEVFMENGTPVVTSEVGDFETFKEEMKKNTEGLSKKEKKQYDKLFKNEKKLRKTYEEGVGYRNQILKMVKSYLQNNIINSLSTDLENYNDDSNW